MPESYRTGLIIKTKPLWKVYYPDHDLSRNIFFKISISSSKLSYLVKGKSIQHDKNNQNGTIISKEKSSDDIEVIMLSKQVRSKFFS